VFTKRWGPKDEALTIEDGQGQILEEFLRGSATNPSYFSSRQWLQPRQASSRGVGGVLEPPDDDPPFVCGEGDFTDSVRCYNNTPRKLTSVRILEERIDELPVSPVADEFPAESDFELCTCLERSKHLQWPAAVIDNEFGRFSRSAHATRRVLGCRLTGFLFLNGRSNSFCVTLDYGLRRFLSSMLDSQQLRTVRRVAAGSETRFMSDRYHQLVIMHYRDTCYKLVDYCLPGR